MPAGGEAEQDRVVQRALQTLLAERFNLAVRRATREVPMYALVMARRDGRPGPLLKRSTIDCSPEGREARIAAVKAGRSPGTCGMNVGVGRIRVGNLSMAEFARNLTGAPGPGIGRSVIDRTGLSGAWQFELTFMPDQFGPPPGPNAPPPDPDAPSLTAVLAEQLGLKLEPTRGTIEVLVVERVERPTEN